MKLKKTHLPVLAAFMLVSFTACHKQTPEEPTGPKRMEDLVVPSNFNWESTREVTLTLAVDFPGSIGLLSRINVYDANPLENGVILLTGSAGYNFPFVSTLRIPTAVSQLYLELLAADGTTRIIPVNVTNDIVYTFTPVKSLLKNHNELSDPNCTAGCDKTPAPGSAVINDGKVYCITGVYNGSISINKGTLRICGTFTGTISMSTQGDNSANLYVTAGGTANIGSLNMDKNCKIIVYGNSVATIGSFNLNQNAKVYNYGTLTINSNFNPNDIVQNFGTMTVNGTYNMNGNSSELFNAGTLAINNGQWNVINKVTNEGGIETSGDINFNNSEVINDCKIISHGNINFNNVEYESDAGYIRAYTGAIINGGASLKLKNKSMLTTTDLIVNNDVEASGSTSVIKATSSGRINGNKKIHGPIEMLTPSGTLLNGSYPANFEDGAKLRSIANTTITIPVGDCNPEGNIPTPPPSNDRDGDGVPNDLDDYPDDATRAYNNYFPGKDQFATLAFEDLWPSKGDYDMNDLVLDCNYWYITNAQNKVVDVKPKFYVRAGGATLKNGFGFQFDGVIPAAVQSVLITPSTTFQYNYINLAANGVENNQAKAVVIAFDNYENVIHRAGGSFYNTVNNGFYGLSDTVFINLHFATPQTQSDVGTPPYNPFLIKDLNRGIEIHLPDRIPTSLADVSYFGAGDDDSNPAMGRYYKSNKSLPWGIMTPQKFDYTWELVEIVFGHLKFGAWAESGGVQFPDWYKNLPGYRNAADIYVKP
jgi:LruC domain-containing protein